MYVETVPNRNSRPAVLLREGWREGGRVRKRTLANLTDWPAEKVRRLRQVLKGQPLVSPEEAFIIERSLPHGHVEAVLAMTGRLGLDRIIAPKRSPERDRVLAMVVGRLLHPGSELAATRWWHTTTLAWELDLGEADEADLYEAMDWLLARRERIERRLAQRHLREGASVFADVSGSCYEGRTCPPVRFGYNRDGKRGKPQVVHTVLSAAGGCPVAVQAHPGNTADPNTVTDRVPKLRERFGFQRVMPVGDRGQPAQVQIDHPGRHPGLGWVSALRAAQVRSPVEAEALRLSLFDERNPAGFVSPDHPGERPVGCCNPLPVQECARKREALLAAVEAGLERIAREAARCTPLDAAQPGHEVGRVISRHGMAKHFRWTVRNGRLIYERDHARIDAEARLDGIHVLRAGEPAGRLSPEDTVRTCKGPTDIERWFRALQGARHPGATHPPPRGAPGSGASARVPAGRVSGAASAPRLGAAAVRRRNPARRLAHPRPRRPRQTHSLRPAQESIPAHRRRSALHSLDTLLGEPATRRRNTCRVPADPSAPPLSLLTEPTPTRRRAAQLIESFPVPGTPKAEKSKSKQSVEHNRLNLDRSRDFGLGLVPVSSTRSVGARSGDDWWRPTMSRTLSTNAGSGQQFSLWGVRKTPMRQEGWTPHEKPRIRRKTDPAHRISIVTPGLPIRQ